MQQLFAPCVLGPFSLRNYLVSLPFYTAYADADGRVTPQLISHYRRIAASGVGLVVAEASAVRDPIPLPHTIHAFDEANLPGLRALAKAIQAEGAVAVLQICHTGRYCKMPGGLAPSPVPAFGVPELTPRAMNEADMERVTGAFAESADIVRRAGFDGVELHGGTGYLLASFTSPRTNLRSDEYGGTVENRARFITRVCRAVRDKVGDYPVGYRFMAREYIPGGLSLEEGAGVAAIIARELAPAYFSVTAGSHECFAWLAEQKLKTGEGFMLAEAGAIRKTVPTVPVIAAGLLQSREICASALATGQADAIGLGRVLFADFDWLNKTSGKKAGPARACVQCNTCIRQISASRPAFCSRWTKEEKQAYLRDVEPGRVISPPKGERENTPQ